MACPAAPHRGSRGVQPARLARLRGVVLRWRSVQAGRRSFRPESLRERRLRRHASASADFLGPSATLAGEFNAEDSLLPHDSVLSSRRPRPPHLQHARPVRSSVPDGLPPPEPAQAASVAQAAAAHPVLPFDARLLRSVSLAEPEAGVPPHRQGVRRMAVIGSRPGFPPAARP